MWARIEFGSAVELTDQDPEGRFHPSLLWVACAENTQIGDQWDGNTFTRPVLADPLPMVPQSVTPWQIRKALNQTGLRSAVEAAVAAGDQDTQDAWAFATEFRRDHPLVTALGAALGKTEAELDAIFVLAGGL